MSGVLIPFLLPVYPGAPHVHCCPVNGLGTRLYPCGFATVTAAGNSPWPPGPGPEYPARSSPPVMKGRVRTAIQPESTGLELARGSRGVTTPVPCVYLPVSLTAPGSSGSAEPARLCRGCSRPHRRPPARTSSSFTPPLRRQRDRGLPPPSGTPAPRGALRLPSAPPSCCDRTGSKGLSPPLEPQRLTAHARSAAHRGVQNGP